MIPYIKLTPKDENDAKLQPYLDKMAELVNKELEAANNDLLTFGSCLIDENGKHIPLQSAIID